LQWNNWPLVFGIDMIIITRTCAQTAAIKSIRHLFLYRLSPYQLEQSNALPVVC